MYSMYMPPLAIVEPSDERIQLTERVSCIQWHSSTTLSWYPNRANPLADPGKLDPVTPWIFPKSPPPLHLRGCRKDGEHPERVSANKL